MNSRIFRICLWTLMLCLTLTLMLACNTTGETGDTSDTIITGTLEVGSDAATIPDVTPADTTADTTVDGDVTTDGEVATEAATEGETLDPFTAAVNAADMPTDGDNFVIGDVNSDSDISAQYTLLTTYAAKYADKQFTVYGQVMQSGETLYISLGEAGYLPFVKPAGMFGPVVGDTVALTATFGPMADAPTTFVFTVSDFELVERPDAPNGGEWMFVVVNTSLNVRAVPTSSGNDPIGVFYRGDAVEVLEFTENNWAKIVYPDAEDGFAYVSAQYLEYWEFVPENE